MLEMTKVKVRGSTVRFQKIEGDVWIVAKDALYLFRIYEKVRIFYHNFPKTEIKQVKVEDTTITVISIKGVQKLGELYPDKYDESLLDEVLEKINNEELELPADPSKRLKRRLFGMMSHVAKESRMTAYELWSESYDLFSVYVGFDIRQKAKERHMTVIAYIESTKLLEEFYMFAEATFVDESK